MAGKVVIIDNVDIDLLREQSAKMGAIIELLCEDDIKNAELLEVAEGVDNLLYVMVYNSTILDRSFY